MHIREAEQMDIPDILQLIKDSYTPYKDLIHDNSIPVYTYDEVNALLNESQSDAWVAEDRGRIVGMAAGTELGPCSYHLKMMFVLGQSQHMGVGSNLLECFEKRGIERHYSLFTANYLGWAKWSWAFYKKHNYREYVLEDEVNNHDLKAQADFLREIGRLNNGGKHLVYKSWH